MVNKNTGVTVWFFISQALLITLCQSAVAIALGIVINLCFCLISGKGKGIIWGLAPIIVLGLVSFLFKHSGDTVLFKINYVKYTLDDFISGCISGAIIALLYYIFLSLSLLVDGDGLGRWLGKSFPTLGCALALGLRQMDRTGRKATAVMALQNNFGVAIKKPRLIKRCATVLMGIISLLTEESMVTAQSMVMRGYNGMGESREFNFKSITPLLVFLIFAVIYYMGFEYIFALLYALFSALPLCCKLRWNRLWR